MALKSVVFQFQRSPKLKYFMLNENCLQTYILSYLHDVFIMISFKVILWLQS